MKYFKHNYLLYIFMIFILLVLWVISIIFGQVNISINDFFYIFSGNIDKVTNQSFPYIIFQLRIPRTILAITVGAALSLSGVVTQALVKTPLAEPYLLGVSSGAYLGASIFFSIFSTGMALSNFGISTFAFLGALVSIILVLVIASINGRASMTKLILSGTIINVFFISIANFILTIFGTNDGIVSIKFWTMGSFTQANWNNIIIPIIVTTISFIFFMLMAKKLNVFVQGDLIAKSLGLNIDILRAVLLIMVSLLTAIIVSVSGIIGFVGLIIPHLCRILFGVDHRKLIPTSILLGSSFLLICDLISRIIVNNSEIPIGIITAIIGAPIFCFALIKSKYGRSE